MARHALPQSAPPFNFDLALVQDAAAEAAAPGAEDHARDLIVAAYELGREGAGDIHKIKNLIRESMSRTDDQYVLRPLRTALNV